MLLHVGKGRSNLVRSLTTFASKRVVTHCQVMLPYLIVTLANLQVSPGGIQDITLACTFLCAAAMCRLPQCLSLKCPVRIKSPLHLNRYHPWSFLRRQHQGNQSGITLDHWNHPKMTLCQTLTRLGLSCQNSTHWNRKYVALVSSLKNNSFEMASG